MKINNVKKYDLWTQIEDRKRTMSKLRPTWESQTFADYPGASVYYLEKDWISNLIPESELINHSDHGKALFIAAQTGSGKTTFVFEKCLPIAKEKGKKVLYLCSRSALAAQIKRIAMSHSESCDELAGKGKVKDLKNIYTDAGLKGRVNFGSIDIITYQSFIQDPSVLAESTDYEFIIADESHFVVSDAYFNPLTEAVLDNMIDHFCNCIRIYLTATPQECLDVVYNFEFVIQERMEHLRYPALTIYNMEHNYTYLKPHFFSKQKEILDEIIKRKNEFWLIFVRNKAVGRDIQDALIQAGIQADYITAEEKDDTVYADLIEKERLANKVLITTRVLDVGINIKNKGEFNIVIFEDDLVEIQQMLGRKRINPAESINAYFYTPSLVELNQRRNLVLNRINNLDVMLEQIDYGGYFEHIEPPFFFFGYHLDFNKLFLRKTECDLKRYDDLIEKMSKLEGLPQQQQCYAEELLSHFNGVIDISPDFVENLEKELKQLLTDSNGKTLNKDDFESFSLKVKEVYGDTRGKKRDTALGVSNVRDILAKFGFTVITKGNPVTYTILEEGPNV